MPNDNYSRTNIAKHEALFTNRFIAALTKDIVSGKHSSETNYQALQAGIYFLNNRQLCPQLTVEQIVRGTMNMALSLEVSGSQCLHDIIIRDWQKGGFLDASDRWFGDYNQKLKNKKANRWDLAIPVIERASKGPLFMATDCCPVTATLYFDYVKQFEPEIKIPNLPLGRNNDDSKRANRYDGECRRFKDEDEFFTNMLIDLNKKIRVLKEQQGFNESIKIAEKLSKNLEDRITIYSLNVSPESRKGFLAYCLAKINEAKPMLEKELGWGEYLNNLLKAFANMFNAAINSITGSNLGFFTLTTAPVVTEVDEIISEFSYYNR